LLVHPGGPLWAKKDNGAWSIPKGEIENDDDALLTAKREFEEELGRVAPSGETIELEPIRQPGGKCVHAWAIEGELDAAAIRSNTFTMEWPPKSGRRGQFPEVDRAQWYPLDVARRKILKGQAPLLDQLALALSDRLDE
jgi:predicted NUDIX family NTP pyrophosphohydrolase